MRPLHEIYMQLTALPHQCFVLLNYLRLLMSAASRNNASRLTLLFFLHLLQVREVREKRKYHMYRQRAKDGMCRSVLACVRRVS